MSDPGELVSIETVEVYDDPLDVKSIPQKRSTAVTYKGTVKLDGQQETSTETAHVVIVGDHWTAIMTDSELAPLKAGKCP